MADGAVVEQGPPRDVLVNPTHPATRALLDGERGRAGQD
jgi:ABC-type antimicrobial peptide transport system ATPase subunit